MGLQPATLGYRSLALRQPLQYKKESAKLQIPKPTVPQTVVGTNLDWCNTQHLALHRYVSTLRLEFEDPPSKNSKKQYPDSLRELPISLLTSLFPCSPRNAESLGKLRRSSGFVLASWGLRLLIYYLGLSCGVEDEIGWVIFVVGRLESWIAPQ